MGELLSVGHGTAGREALAALLGAAGVTRVVDVRRFPGSRRNPDVSTDAMGEWLPAAGVAYRWDARLGGRRRVPEGGQDVDRWWRVEAFRGYAAHMRTPEFHDGLDALAADAEAADGAVAFLCSESLWWRCHRRMVSDALVLLRGRDVRHLGHDGRTTVHVASEGARVDGDAIYYDAG
ncbi:DUF488 domain-containing protein [Aeromicrobium massiliense]|uniref:DUF488 domain-containing protein n=1 Tax=Aeromicrobium massiliense TaxID=1464554 RepID=UPI0002E83DDE|nr:DUF488 domain-containing protein [Aeromicrobium massiliense]